MPLALCMHSYNCRATLLNSAMETLDSAVSTPSRTSDSKPQTSSPLPPSVLRLWRPAAQRNLRNQWSQLVSCKNRWFSASSVGRSHATALELQRSKLVLSYKDMVGIVSDMINVSRSMKCFFKGSNNSPLLQFSYNSADQSDSGEGGEGGGIPVFTFYSITSHETHGPVPPRLRDGKSDIDALRFDNQPNPEVLQVYLTTWLAEANIDTPKVNEIFAIVGEEMQVSVC
ncbi:hypothetical protein GmHk_05G012170 [Glycine max]|nr:hypothetical protein GmHk_05G012170 [Glycine max]